MARFPLIAALALVLAAQAWACNVPVFRYALERWPPDYYELIVFSKGPLKGEHKKLFDGLMAKAEKGESYANFGLVSVDTTGNMEPELKEIWEKQKPKEMPWALAFYPATSEAKGAFWTGSFTEANVKLLEDSPVRREVARRILKGESAVWVFIDSGNKEQDQKIHKKLDEILKKMKKVFELPEQDDPEPDPMMGEDEEGGELAGIPELRLDFSIVRLARTDAKEQAFLQLLLGLEKGLKELKEPMVFPVIGRGRALYACVGKGISEERVADACGFMLGPCSCQIKDLNPGTDLLMNVNWEDLISGRVVVDKELPPLTGVGAMAAATDEKDKKDPKVPGPEKGTETKVAKAGQDAPASGIVAPPVESTTKPPVAATTSDEKAASNALVRNIFAAIIIAIILVVGASVVLKSRSG